MKRNAIHISLASATLVLACGAALPAAAADADDRRRAALQRTAEKYVLPATGQARTANEATIQRAADADLGQMVVGSIASADPYDARGVVTPNAEVTLGAGVQARIEAMPFREGEAFREGQILVEFDCARPKAELRAVKANLSKAVTYHKGKKRLLARGAAGRQEVSEAAADVRAAAAQSDALAETVSLCTVAAPFDGRVVEHHADRYEIPAQNAPVLTVVDDSRLELDLIVPSKWLRWVSSGTRFTFSVDEVGDAFEAKVMRVGAKVDAVSQTVKLTGSFARRPSSVLAGMSGTARFEPPFK